nr:hypothetical protein F02E9.8 - Caenorhabditis elegans [Caenorhabditis elegans]
MSPHLSEFSNELPARHLGRFLYLRIPYNFQNWNKKLQHKQEKLAIQHRAALQAILTDCDNELAGVGISVEGRHIRRLEFADDVVLTCSTPGEVQERLEILDRISSNYGLKINQSKTVLLKNKFCRSQDVLFNGSPIIPVPGCRYLGRWIDISGSIDEEISRRIRAGWGALVGIKEVLRIMPNKERIILFKQNVLPALLYASETWTCNAGSTLRLKRTVTGLIDAAEIRGWNFNLERYLLAKQSRFAGHILRRDPNRWTKICTEWDPSHNKNWKRAVGGQKKRWAKDIDEEYAKFHHNSAMSGQVVVGRRRLGMLTPKAPWLSIARTDREKWKEFVRSCLAT